MLKNSYIVKGLESKVTSPFTGDLIQKYFDVQRVYNSFRGRYRINFEGETLYVFDLLVPEIFHEGQKRKKGESAPQSEETKPVNTRKGFYPDDIAGTFGVPVEEHLKESEVTQIDGYVSMGILTGKAPGTSAD